MPGSNLHGLNIVQPPQDPSDPQDLLLGHSYPDLTAQLDLWTNLAFDSDEPLAPRSSDHKISMDEDEEEARSPVTQEKAVRDGHVNVVTPTNISINQSANATPLFDLNAFLAGFGLDSYSHPSQLQQQSNIAPSLAQLLALHPGHNPGFSTLSATDYTAPSETANNSSVTSRVSASEASIPTKRARTRKTSISHHDSAETYREETPGPASSTPLSAAEDKRRRNTAASARFRLKKKEREAALEGKAKELETKVSELERECEGLRRENGWLKGLVVGVTGAAQAPSAQGISVSSPTSGMGTGAAKRRRDDEA